MSYFTAVMHQIRFRLGLYRRPRWGSLQRSLRPTSWIQESLHVRGRKGGKEKGERRRRQKVGERLGTEGKGRKGRRGE